MNRVIRTITLTIALVISFASAPLVISFASALAQSNQSAQLAELNSLTDKI